eukprot:COSAG06_NODE_886_length_11771_cov_13.431203_1_plen_188_part_00
MLMHECVSEPWAEQPQGARLCSPPRPPRWDSPAVRSCYSVRSLFCGSWVHGPQTVSQRCELAAPAVISLIRRMLTTGELARREASSSDPERLVVFSRHNHLACDQSSRFWPLPASYHLDLLAPAAGEHAVLNLDRLIDVQSCCQSRTRSPGPRCTTRQIVALCRSPQPVAFQPLPLTSTDVPVRATA